MAGFGTAAWAPMVPFAKQRLAIQDDTLGTLLLCLGLVRFLPCRWQERLHRGWVADA